MGSQYLLCSIGAQKTTGMLIAYNAVFMCDNSDDLDIIGGGDWMFTLEALDKVEKHDANWGSQIDAVIKDGKTIDDAEVEQCADNYWNSVPSCDPLWEYLTTEAKIMACEPF